MNISLLFICLFGLYFSSSRAQCHNNCNQKGLCDKYSRCRCMTGYSGNDCSIKNCPTGPRMADIPYYEDSAHASDWCSGRGTCDTKTGSCTCFEGFSGIACEKLSCFNGCSGHGECLSLREAAILNDGYHFNRSTVYTNWDADLMTGCKCDRGWSGSDCSQRQCEIGIDPRVSNLKFEKVIFVCECSGTCSGKFKFRFLGKPTKKWLTPSSKAYEIAGALMTIPGIASNSSMYSQASVYAYNSTEYDAICASGSIKKTTIQFQRNPGDLPSISFYGKSISGGDLYFEVSVVLYCIKILFVMQYFLFLIDSSSIDLQLY